MHAKGVYFGIYSDEGTMTCGGYPGTEYHEAQDALTLASPAVGRRAMHPQTPLRICYMDHHQ